MARTQQQRREDTIARLLDAAIETIIDVGYARASAKVIAKRAQVSDGALFRHFPTMSDFMAATAHEVMRRQLEVAAKRIADIPADRTVLLEEILTMLRDLTSNPQNTVMYELAVAARTDEKLCAAYKEVMAEYYAKIFAAAQSSPVAGELEVLGGQNAAALVAVLINTFDGAAIFRPVLTAPEVEDRRIPLLLSLLGAHSVT